MDYIDIIVAAQNFLAEKRCPSCKGCADFPHPDDEDGWYETCDHDFHKQVADLDRLVSYRDAIGDRF